MEVIERIAMAIREAEIADGQCDEATTFASYLPAARAALKALRATDPMTIPTKYPKPMAFDEAWDEVFESLLAVGQAGQKQEK